MQVDELRWRARAASDFWLPATDVNPRPTMTSELANNRLASRNARAQHRRNHGGVAVMGSGWPTRPAVEERAPVPRPLGRGPKEPHLARPARGQRAPASWVLAGAQLVAFSSPRFRHFRDARISGGSPESRMCKDRGPRRLESATPRVVAARHSNKTIFLPGRLHFASFRTPNAHVQAIFGCFVPAFPIMTHLPPFKGI